MWIVARSYPGARGGKKAWNASYIRTGRRPKGGEVTIEEIRRTNECLWHGEGQAISPSSSSSWFSSSSSSAGNARHKTTRTKELRRCTIRAHDGRMKIRGGRRNSKTSDVLRRCWRDSVGKVQDTKDRRKEGPTTSRRSRGCGRRARGMGGGVFCLSDIKEPVANFLPSSIPVSSLSRSLPAACPSRCPSYPPEVIRGRVPSTRIYTYTRCVPS